MKSADVIAKWDGMSPRERDAWVAEIIFGNKVRRLPLFDCTNEYVTDEDANRDLLRYTTDISAAWAVLNAVSGEIILFRILPNKFVASFGYSAEECTECGEDPFEVEAQGIAETAPEAICLAGILAKLIAKVTEEGGIAV